LLGTVLLLAAANSEPVDLSKHFAGTRESCFALLDLKTGTTYRHNPERCAKRFSPCSTFKIPHRLIGLQTGVIRDIDHVMRWDGQKRSREAWNQDQTLRSAVRDSVVWYFQELARGVGMERMKGFVDAMGYGNRNLSGGLTRFWLESSLLISADEQVDFLKRLMREDFGFTKRTFELVRAVLVLDDRGGTVLRGKTGTGENFGWFVGTVTGPRGDFVFAGNASGPGVTGQQVRKITEAILAERGIWPPPPPAPAP
jgi:beta-lactamase class D